MTRRPAVALALLLALAATAAAQPPARPTLDPLPPLDELLGRLPPRAKAAVEPALKGRGHWARGEYEAAGDCYRAALAKMRELFPEDDPVVGQCHGMLAGYYLAAGDPVTAEPHARRFREAFARRPPDAPPRLWDLNRALAASNYAMVLQELGDWPEAERYGREALDLRRRLHPDPAGHLDLVVSLGNLATVLAARGEMAAAEGYAAEAHAMALRLTDGKPHEALDPAALARTVGDLAEFRRGRGEDAEALRLHDLAVQFERQIYPGGHPALAISIRNLAIARLDLGDAAAAVRGLEEARDMLQRSFPPARYPHGHPKLCQVVRDLGMVRAATGDAAGVADLRAALRMADGLFPPARHPDGHPAVVACLGELGAAALLTPGGDAAAAGWFRDALGVSARHTTAVADRLAEAEILNLQRATPGYLNGLLSATAGGPFDPRDYRHVWDGKATAARALERRRQALLAGRDPPALQLDRELEAVRVRLSARLADPTRPTPDPEADRLTADKERLERELAARLRLPARAADAPAHPFDLVDRLPPAAAFVDFVRYQRVTRGAAGRSAAPHYAAFVLARGRRPERVELGPAGRVDDAVDGWRRAIVVGGPDERAAAKAVADLVWTPVAAHLPAGLGTVYLAPDGPLNRVPFAALPDGGGVLLERAAVAVVPHGRFLLDRLTTAPPARAGRGKMLLVGGADYGGAARPLTHTRTEVERVERLAARVGAADPQVLADARPTVPAVLAALPDARFAHLATHGYFAAPPVGPGDLRTAGTRNPLALSGLVFARAAADPPDRGRLTAEAVAGQRLDGMDQAVLSACETGLGVAAGGEGVFGLQRAFHAAGCRTVVASLWEVGDKSTLALMQLYYERLWAADRPTPAAALREAQLELYRKPGRVDELTRGVEVVPAVAPAPPPTPAGGPARSPTHQWAGFVVSAAP